MEYTKLGNTGMDVSRICLGCMTYGDPRRGFHEWTLDEERSRFVFDTTRSFSHRPFKVKEHVDRLYRSLRYIRLDPGIAIRVGGLTRSRRTRTPSRARTRPRWSAPRPTVIRRRSTCTLAMGASAPLLVASKP